MIGTIQANLFKQAQDIGAVTFRVFQIDSRTSFGGTVKDNFAYHFFDKNDEEVCYYNVGLREFGLNKFGVPRVWSDEFKNSPSYTKPQRVDDYLFAWQ